MESKDILKELIDNKTLKILNHFISNEGSEFYLREISRITGVSPASTYRILNKLVKLQVIKLNELKTTKLYSLEHNNIVIFLKSILKIDLVQQFVEKVSKLRGVKQILMLGTPSKTKANVLVLGNNIDNSKIKFICGEIKEKYNYTINQMTLTKEQYEQMSQMGLYPGGKKIIYTQTHDFS